MNRVAGLVVALLAAAAVGYVIWLGLPAGDGVADPGDRFVTVNFVEPQVTEFTPAGVAKFRAEVVAARDALPSTASYRQLDPTNELLARQALKQGKAIEAYKAVAPEYRKELFRKLADQMGRQADDLPKLLDAYEADFPGDPWAKFHRAGLANRKGDPAAAEPLYAAAVVGLPGEEQVQAAWMNCLLGLNRWKDAYAAAKQDRLLFRRIAANLFQKEDAASLAGLCDLHAAAVPDDPESEYYRGWAFWLKKDYAQANKTWDAYLAPGGERAIPPAEYDRPFRALFRKNRLADARAFVDHPPTAADATDVRVWRALVAAKDGKPAEVSKALDELKATAPGFRWWADRDLKPLVEAEAMADVRKRFPKSE